MTVLSFLACFPKYMRDYLIMFPSDLQMDASDILSPETRDYQMSRGQRACLLQAFVDSMISLESREDAVDDQAFLSKTIKAEKLPPPEKKEEIRTRRLIIFSLWAIIAFLGLPAWYATTTVPRAVLPLDSMNKWAEGRGGTLNFAVHVALDALDMASDTMDNLVQMVQERVDQKASSNIHRLQIHAAVPEPLQGNLGADSDVYADAKSGNASNHELVVVVRQSTDVPPRSARTTLRPFQPVLEMLYHPMTLSSRPGIEGLAQHIANELTQTFAEERATIGHILGSDAAFAKTLDLQNQQVVSQDWQKRSNRAFKYASTYHLTFSLFSGSSLPSSWDIKAALEEYLRPFLESFASISAFTVDTQVQLYASLSSSLQGPTYDEDSQQWTLLQSDLSSFVNAAEWPLSPSIGTGPTINFVVYVPSEEQSPLVIRENGGTSWLIPQWGGVQIVNPDTGLSDAMLTKESLEPVMRIFADQLDALLGLPQTPASLPLRLSSLARERTASLILSASSTLGALARLTLKLTAIAIPDNVAVSVSKAIHHLELACQELNEGRVHSALEHARSAEAQAEQAFFDPSMVGQVYFPDEHKVAVYVPLLGPMAVPLVMAAVKEIKKIRQSRSLSY